ncbi:transforming growth factor beta receptor type 3-like [Schistocerca piceifrons]|uniref:transforming growth factor beta receptor type 3-like n=1 Tax=Schistocerca piceifrons TaxID=274613 RepID=UPI001F5F4854|nr:transforming growth factor beta receptor type 3-like [Schistocerca piceifrons]
MAAGPSVLGAVLVELAPTSVAVMVMEVTEEDANCEMCEGLQKSGVSPRGGMNQDAIQVQPAGIEETSEDKEFYGDLAESEGIPIVCKNQPYYIGGKVDVSDSSTFDMVEHNGVRHKSLYNMDLFRDKELNQQLHFDPLNLQIEEVRYGEQIFVRAWMEGGGTKVQLVTENCWLTNSSDPKSKIQKFLLRNACPVDSAVSLLQQHGSFSFKTSPEYVEVGVVYMHCRIGMCTYLESLTKGNLALCVNRTQHCSKPRSQPLVNQTTVSTAQQIVTRGPLKFVPNFLTHVKSIAAIPSPTSAEAVFPHVVDMSTTCVSIQATVGIALTSFVIGIVLMIIIWFIHVKTDPLRHHRTKQVHQTGGITTGNISAGGTVFSVPPNSVGSSANL